MKKLLIVVGASMMMTFAITAKSQSLTQNYRTALGIKVWPYGGGVSLKHFVFENQALEAVGFAWDRGARITGLYEFHFNISGAPGLKWYLGPGAHAGFYNDHFNDRYGNYGQGGSYAGIDGVLGLDYKFDRVPINMSLDWQPSIEFGPDRGFFGGWGGLAVRYTF